MLWQPVVTATAAKNAAKRKMRLLMLLKTCSLTGPPGQAGLGDGAQIIDYYTYAPILICEKMRVLMPIVGKFAVLTQCGAFRESVLLEPKQGRWRGRTS
jgi:hypothetical protein